MDQSKEYNCPDCGGNYGTRNRRKNHMNKQHTKATCQICKKKFYSADRLKQHMGNAQHKKQNKTGVASGQNKTGVASGQNPHINVSPFRLHTTPQNSVVKMDPFPSVKMDPLYKDYGDAIKPDINKAARRLHDNHARPVPRRDDQGFQDCNQVIKHLADAMRDKGLASRQEYVGGMYERTSTQSSDYDVQFVNRDLEIAAQAPEGKFPGYAKLVKEGKSISPKEYVAKMKGSVQKIINEADFGDIQVRMCEHGPAITLTISRKDSQKNNEVDIVPAIETKGGEIFVCKSPKTLAGEKANLWRKSHSIEAKKKLLEADSDGGCRRDTYRLMKYIRDQENLHHIPSYHLKSALFHFMDIKHTKAYWSPDRLGECTGDFAKYVGDKYRSGRLLDYFDQGMNLLDDTSPAMRENTANRMDYLTKHPEVMFQEK